MKMEALFEIWNGHCAYCGVKLKLKPEPKEKRAVPTRDHFIPLAAGGGNGKRNHVLACKPCNAHKGSFDPRVMIKVWHQLDPKSLQKFIEALEAPIAPRGISARLKALLRPKSPPKKKLN